MADDDTLPFDPSFQIGIPRPPRAQPVTIQDLTPLLRQPLTTNVAPQSGSQQPTYEHVGGKAPATIRYNNPGGMWPQESSRKFGSNSYGVIGGGNLIAKFDTPEAGAAAQFDLLASPKYSGMPIGRAIDKWSGHTGGAANVSAYANSVARSIGLSPDDILTPQIVQSPSGIAFAKAMARQEAGVDYPMSDQQWQAAQQMAFGQPAQAQQQQVQAQGQTIGDYLRQVTR